MLRCLRIEIAARAAIIRRTQHAMLHAQYSFQPVSPPKGHFLRKWGRTVWVFLVGRHLRARVHSRKELYRCAWMSPSSPFQTEASVPPAGHTLILDILDFNSLSIQDILDNLKFEASFKRGAGAHIGSSFPTWYQPAETIVVSFSFRWYMQSSLPQSLPLPAALSLSLMYLIFLGPCLYLRTIGLSGRGLNAYRQLSVTG